MSQPDSPPILSREPTPDDACLLFPLYEAADLALLGEVDVSLLDVDALLRDPRADLAKSRLLSSADDTPVAVLVSTCMSRDVPRIDLELVVAPESPGLF